MCIEAVASDERWVAVLLSRDQTAKRRHRRTGQIASDLHAERVLRPSLSNKWASVAYIASITYFARSTTFRFRPYASPNPGITFTFRHVKIASQRTT